MENLYEIRKNFPALNHINQLSSCSQSALHIDVKNSIEQYVQTWEKEGMDWELWMKACEDSREKFAKMINADPNEIAIVSSVSHAISSVLVSLKVPATKNEAILSKKDFPCIGHSALSQTNYQVTYVETTTDDYMNSISSNTIFTSAPFVSFYDGERLDIKAIGEAAHQKGSYFFVDAYQAAGQIDIDVKELDVDFLASGMQKYMLGMPGVAFLYIKKGIAQELTPKITGWFGQSNPFSFNGEEVIYADGARRFDSGTFSMIHGFASSSAMDILLKVGIHKIEKYLQGLSSFTLQYATEKGLDIASKMDATKKGSNTAIKVENADEVELLMRKRNIIVSARNDVIRIAPHFYNTKEDIQSAIDELVDVLR